MTTYYDTTFSNTVKLNGKLHRITMRNQVPYITYKRKTRVLYKNPIGGAYINVGPSRVYFL